jgi:transcriptional adapter 3
MHIDPSPTPTTSLPTGPISTYGAHLDFSLPPAPSRPLVPPRPGVQKPPQPGPKRQADVDEDFSNTKAPTQTAQPTFWTSVEPYLREIREDDLAVLNFKVDAPESYEIPARGKHYTEVWDEEDGMPIGTTPRIPVPSMRHAHHASAGPSRMVPATELREEHLVEEHKGLGSLSERLVAGIVGGVSLFSSETKGTNINKYDGNRDLARVDVVDLEERMKRELKGSILLNDQEEVRPLIQVRPSCTLTDLQHASLDRDDDEVTAALRQCQRLLLEQTQINDARKSRLADIAQHRLAYAEYTTSLDGVEKSIELAWGKRVKKFGAGPKKTSTSGDPGARPPVSENVKKLVHVRQAWVDSVGKAMKARPKGEVMGIPEESVYEGLGEEVDEKVVDEAVELATDEE